MGYYSKNLKLLFICICALLPLVLIGCGSDNNKTNQFTIDVSGYELTYNGNQNFERVALKTDDLDEITDLYQEVGDNVGYRDSLLIATKYNPGFGINTFVQNNLDTLNEHGLTLSNLEKNQIELKNNNEVAVLVNYNITEGFISEVPVLYVSQLFIPDGNNVKLVSFISEDSSSRGHAINMFKKIK